MKLIQSALVLLVGANAFASSDVQSLRCFHDMRPVDGNLVEVTLSRQADGKYTAVEHIVTAGFGSPVQDITKKVASGLTCKFGKQDSRLVACHKSSSDEGETQNSGLQVDLVTTQSVEYTGEVGTYQHFKVTGYSPTFPGSDRLELEIPVKGAGIPSGCEVN